MIEETAMTASFSSFLVRIVWEKCLIEIELNFRS